MADRSHQIIEELRANGGTVSNTVFGRVPVLVHHLGALTPR